MAHALRGRCDWRSSADDSPGTRKKMSPGMRLRGTRQSDRWRKCRTGDRSHLWEKDRQAFNSEWRWLWREDLLRHFPADGVRCHPANPRLRPLHSPRSQRRDDEIGVTSPTRVIGLRTREPLLRHRYRRQTAAISLNSHPQPL
jgi:hypothetical protein